MRFAFLSILVLAFAPLAVAQTVVDTFEGDTPGAEVGRFFDVVGDIDGDGTADVLIGYPFDDTVATDAGRVVLVSGADGSELWELFGEDPDERLGYSVSAAGDVDGDLVPDFIVATPWRRDDHGGGELYSGADFSVNISYRGLHEGDLFGYGLGIIGDFDNDGFSDTAWSAPGRSTVVGDDRGAIYIYSGIDGATVFELWPPDGLGGNGLKLGMRVSWVGDVDGDTLDDFFASTAATDDANTVFGTACIMSSADGSIIHGFAGADQGGGNILFMGQDIAGAGDVNGDDRNEFLIASQSPGENSRVKMYNGLDGTVLRLYPQAFDASTVARVRNAGDMDGDGFLDHAIAGIVADGIVVYSGQDGSALQTITWPEAGVDFGAAFAAAGDYSQDGHAALAVGVPLDDSAGVDNGLVAVFSGNPCGPAELYCTAGVNSTGGGALMGYVGSSSLARNDLTLTTAGGPASKSGLYFYGPNQIQAPFGEGFRCVGGTTRRLSPILSDANGFFERDLDYNLPPLNGGANQVTPGSGWNFQLWYRDPMGGPSGYNLSDGIGIQFCD